MANKGQMPTLQSLNQVPEAHHMTEHHGNRMWHEHKSIKSTHGLHTEHLQPLVLFLGCWNLYQTFWRSLGGSVQDKKKVKEKQNCEHVGTMALPPTTVTQTQCWGVYGLATFFHEYMYEKTVEHSGEHFTILFRIRGHTQGLQDIKGGNSLRKVDSDATHDLWYACFLTFIMLTLMALTHMETHSKPNQMVWDKEKVKPHRTPQGQWHVAECRKKKTSQTHTRPNQMPETKRK